MAPTDLQVVDEAAAARALLQEPRLALLEQLETPASAATLARRLDLPRQRLNYHLRELEAAGLIELVEERSRGNVTERIYRRSSVAYALSPDLLGALAATPDDVHDRFSSAFLLALANRTLAEVGALRRGAAAANQKLPTFALDAEVRFANAADRAAFAEELAAAVAKLVQRYHDDAAPRGRTFRLATAVHPKPKDPNLS